MDISNTKEYQVFICKAADDSARDVCLGIAAINTAIFIAFNTDERTAFYSGCSLIFITLTRFIMFATYRKIIDIEDNQSNARFTLSSDRLLNIGIATGLCSIVFLAISLLTIIF